MTTMKTFLAVKNEGAVPQIFIQGFIGSSWFFEGNTDKGIKNILDSLGDQEEIEVVINSNGGDVFQGIAIGNLLKSNKAKVNVVINGLAASAASIIAMAGDTIKIYNNAQLMIHRASTYGEGNVDDFRTIADQLESIDKSVKASYKTRFNGTDEALQELLEKESLDTMIRFLFFLRRNMVLKFMCTMICGTTKSIFLRLNHIYGGNI